VSVILNIDMLHLIKLNREILKIKLVIYINIIKTNMVKLVNNLIKLISNIKDIVIRIGIYIQDIVVFSLNYFYNANISYKILLIGLFLFFHNFLISMIFIFSTLLQFLFVVGINLFNFNIFDLNLDILFYLFNNFQNIFKNFIIYLLNYYNLNVNEMELGLFGISFYNNLITNMSSDINIIEDLTNLRNNNIENNSTIDNNYNNDNNNINNANIINNINNDDNNNVNNNNINNNNINDNNVNNNNINNNNVNNNNINNNSVNNNINDINDNNTNGNNNININENNINNSTNEDNNSECDSEDRESDKDSLFSAEVKSNISSAPTTPLNSPNLNYNFILPNFINNNDIDLNPVPGLNNSPTDQPLPENNLDINNLLTNLSDLESRIEAGTVDRSRYDPSIFPENPENIDNNISGSDIPNTTTTDDNNINEIYNNNIVNNSTETSNFNNSNYDIYENSNYDIYENSDNENSSNNVNINATNIENSTENSGINSNSLNNNSLEQEFKSNLDKGKGKAK